MIFLCPSQSSSAQCNVIVGGQDVGRIFARDATKRVAVFADSCVSANQIEKESSLLALRSLHVVCNMASRCSDGA